MVQFLIRAAACVGLWFCLPCFAQVSVPAGAAFNLAGASVDLGGVALHVSGAVQLGSGVLQDVSDVTIASGGTLDAGSSTISLFGNWSDSGIFVRGSSHVDFVDGAAAAGSIAGDTTFANLSLVSASGKSYAFAAGSTQHIANVLTLQGTASAGIQLRSSSSTPAYIDLQPGGTQNIQYVGVSHVHATGQPLAPTEINDGGSGDALGWFGNGAAANVAQTPTLSLTSIALLLLGLFALARRALRNPALTRTLP
ncbi:MAG TPA: hypothetical protein VFA81_00510 [Burkholderiales bacterium]|nr:hypothetical protein [Burkholderiales bacterium]